MPTVSVIVPVYKAEEYVSRCIESILNQTYTDWELLLVDDGSPDDSGSICDEYASKDERIRVFHKDNGGVSSARNFGINQAIGDWICFVDADDWLEIDTFRNCCPFFEKSDIIRFSLSLYYGEGNLQSFPYMTCFSSKSEYLSHIVARKTILGVCGGIYKSSLFTDNNICFDCSLINGEDWVVLASLVQNCNQVSFINRPFYVYNKMNEDSCTRVPSYIKSYSGVLALNQLLEIVDKNYSWYNQSISIAKCSLGSSFVASTLQGHIKATIQEIRDYCVALRIDSKTIKQGTSSVRTIVMLSLLIIPYGISIIYYIGSLRRTKKLHFSLS